jgi:hypothetical protein
VAVNNVASFVSWEIKASDGDTMSRENFEEGNHTVEAVLVVLNRITRRSLSNLRFESVSRSPRAGHASRNHRDFAAALRKRLESRHR